MRVHHIALRVADPVRSARFYAALGLAALATHVDEDGAPRSVWLALGDAVLMLERAIRPADGATDGSGHVLVLAVADVAEAEARLAAAGAAAADRTAYTLYCRDPDGHRIGLSAYRFEAASGR